jgi:outer membrane protein OmpA-like peptidoglycan-associated protein
MGRARDTKAAGRGPAAFVLSENTGNRMNTNLVIGAALAALAACACACAPVHGAMRQVGLGGPACADTTLTLYFDEGSDQLTAPGKRLIDTTARHLKRCAVARAVVVGLADAPGAPADNRVLSQRRAERVTEALAAAGLPAPTFELTAEGEAGAVTADGRLAPLRRRADVRLTVQPRAPAS